MIDYKEWEEEEVEKSANLVRKALDMIRRGEPLIPLTLLPELGIKEGEPNTVWDIPGSPTYHESPHTDLRNIESLYAGKNGKILIPIQLYPTRSDFEYVYGMSIETLVDHIKENPEHLKPILMNHPEEYEKYPYFDELFKIFQRTYNELPPFPFLRFITLTGVLSGRDPHDVDKCVEDANTLFDIDSRKSIKKMSIKEHLKSDQIIGGAAGWICGLRLLGFDAQVRKCLELAKALNDPEAGYIMLWAYADSLADPIFGHLGGFVNYDLDDIEMMAFLRLLKFKAEELDKVRHKVMESLLQSPASRSLVLVRKDECKINCFRGGDVDLKSLDAAIELAQKHGEIGKLIVDYHSKASSLDLNGANRVAQRLSEVLTEQYNQEVSEWMKRESYAKKAKSILDFGSTLIILPTIMLSQMPAEWKLLLFPAMEWLKKKLYRQVEILDPKDIVQNLWRVKNWPFAQKGVPYLIWRTQSKV